VERKGSELDRAGMVAVKVRPPGVDDQKRHPEREVAIDPVLEAVAVAVISLDRRPLDDFAGQEPLQEDLEQEPSNETRRALEEQCGASPSFFPVARAARTEDGRRRKGSENAVLGGGRRRKPRLPGSDPTGIAPVGQQQHHDGQRHRRHQRPYRTPELVVEVPVAVIALQFRLAVGDGIGTVVSAISGRFRPRGPRHGQQQLSFVEEWRIIIGSLIFGRRTRIPLSGN